MQPIERIRIGALSHRRLLRAARRNGTRRREVASAKDPEVRRGGRCGGASVWKLKLDDGRIEAEYEVDQNRVGQRWRVVLRDNGRVVFRGIRTTRRPSGSFTIEPRLANRAGSDRSTARARNVRSGEVCGGSARL